MLKLVVELVNALQERRGGTPGRSCVVRSCRRSLGWLHMLASGE